MKKGRKKYLVRMLAVTSSLIIATSAFAKPNTDRVPATNNRSGKIVTIPAHAVEMAPGVFSLGTAVVDGKVVEGIMFIDYKKGYGKPPGTPGGGGGGGKDKKGGSNKCYAHLAKGAKWKVTEPWVLNPSNTQGLSDSFLLSNTAGNIQKWEDEAATDIMGAGSLTTDPLVADEESPDGLNEIYFGSIDSPGAIAVTITWGIFGGKPSGRELVETDQVYDQVDFTWSDSGAADDMDYENISTHELGHSLGMGHPDDGCTEETMYRFATEGETKKRDLNAGDIEGVKDLYK